MDLVWSPVLFHDVSFLLCFSLLQGAPVISTACFTMIVNRDLNVDVDVDVDTGIDNLVEVDVGVDDDVY